MQLPPHERAAVRASSSPLVQRKAMTGFILLVPTFAHPFLPGETLFDKTAPLQLQGLLNGFFTVTLITGIVYLISAARTRARLAAALTERGATPPSPVNPSPLTPPAAPTDTVSESVELTGRDTLRFIVVFVALTLAWVVISRILPPSWPWLALAVVGVLVSAYVAGVWSSSLGKMKTHFATAKGSPGLGGWLALLGLWLFTQPLSLLYNIVQCTLVLHEKHALNLGGMIALISLVLSLLVVIYICTLFIKKKRVFTYWVAGYMAATYVGILPMLYKAVEGTADTQTLVYGAISVRIWFVIAICVMLYLVNSARVRTTFVY